VPAYAAAVKNVAISGVLNQLTFVEVEVSDSTQEPEAMVQLLQAALKEFLARK
jgi:hypothetical protein